MKQANVHQSSENVVPLDYHGLLSLLMNVPGGQFITITADTVQDGKLSAANKEAWGNGRIVKRATAQTNSYVDFKKSVANKRKKLGLDAREIQPRSWGYNLQGTPFVVHRKKKDLQASLYLATHVVRSLGYRFIDTHTGADLSKDFVYSLFKPSARKSKKSEEGIIKRDYKVDGIVRISTGGKHYVIAENLKYQATTGETITETWKQLQEVAD